MSVLSLFLPAVPLLAVMILAGFFVGVVPIPVGYERGKIKWLTWCGTGMHTHVCYWHGGESGLQSIHPNDMSNGGGSE